MTVLTKGFQDALRQKQVELQSDIEAIERAIHILDGVGVTPAMATTLEATPPATERVIERVVYRNNNGKVISRKPCDYTYDVVCTRCGKTFKSARSQEGTQSKHAQRFCHQPCTSSLYQRELVEAVMAKRETERAGKHENWMKKLSATPVVEVLLAGDPLRGGGK